MTLAVEREMGKDAATSAWADWPALRRQIDSILKPRSVAVIGASANRSYVSTIWRNLYAHGFTGETYAVNPNYKEIDGRPCYPSLLDLPGPVDLAVIGVPARLITPVLEQAAVKGVGALDIITSGFGEMLEDAVASQREAELRAFTERTGIRIVGPNCFGLLGAPQKMFAYPGVYANARPGPMGLVLQSGQMVVSLLTPCFDRGMGFQYVVSTGNELDLESADFMRYFVEDPETRVVGCYVEQFRSPAKLVELAELAAAASKPIVAVKIGRSDAAKQAVRAHTGSLAGSDEVVDAVLRQHGITRVKDVDEMVEALAVFHSRKLPRGRRVGAITLSGAACGLLHDLAGEAGVEFPDLAAETKARLAPAMPDYVTVANPLDITGIGIMQPEIFTGAVEGLAAAENLDVVLYLRGVPSKLDAQSAVGKTWLAAVEQHPEKVFVYLSIVGGALHDAAGISGPPAEPVAQVDGIPFLQGATPGLKAVGALVRYAEFLARREASHLPHHTPAPALLERAGAHAAHGQRSEARALIRAAGGRPLTEREGKEILALYGIPATREALAATVDEAKAAARSIGYPVALKVEAPEILHKTEAGALLLDVPDEAALERGYQHVIERARAYAPGAAIRGVLVQEMVRGGHEVILGMTHDPQFGPAVVLGLGGIFAEVLRDVSLRVPPLEEADVREMIGGLRAAPVLRGARGRPPADEAALVDVTLRFAQLCLDVQDLVQEIDVNPLVVFGEGEGAKAVDCLIVPTEVAGDGHA